jgi:hypothetical protein
VLEFYAQRSPIFLAAVFDSDAATDRGQQIGDGTPIQIAIPTTNPWVPLRILGLGKQASDRVEADVFLMTDRQPAILPLGRSGLSLTHNAAASQLLLDELRSDERMEWVPPSAWLTKVSVNSTARDLAYDLAVDASGQGTLSRRAAGLDFVSRSESTPPDQQGGSGALPLLIAAGLGATILGMRWRLG